MDRDAWSETEYKKEFGRRLLAQLIRKYESSKAFASGDPVKQKPQVSFANGPFQVEYEDEMDFRKKEWIHEVVESLASRGIVAVKWEKFREGRQLAKVYLEPDRVEAAYELAGATPRQKKMERLRDILKTLDHHPWEWVAQWSREAVSALNQRKSASLDLDDPEGYERLADVLRELPKLEDDIPKRVLSHRLFQNSKTFERLVERRLVHLIQTRSGIEYDSDADALESVGIADQPRSVWIAGALRCSIGNHPVSLAMFPGGIGLSRDTVRAMTIDEVGGLRIVLIENLTSWHQWVKERQGADEVVVYTGGFPNRAVQQLLRKLGGYVYGDSREEGRRFGAVGGLPVYHWGDMDAGGIQIFEFLRIHFFPDLEPLGMDEQSFLRNAGAGMEYSRSYAKKLKDMLANERFARWHGLIRLMLVHGKRIEQESMAIPADLFG
ncbi:Wadjet anti-phage system protein JetD domain-containing protein [Thermobacillus xylanilyticus]|jgi:hypothetical protein|nr:Wadjet anti-phage system protein JetD domain-containing protein [Thermobacillus xylanilyticus]